MDSVSLQDTYEAIREYFSRPDAVLATTYEEETGETLCCYRTEEGNKCAVGCLFTDEEYFAYVKNLEGRSVGYLIGEFVPGGPPSIVAKLNHDKRKTAFLNEAQNLHDFHAANAAYFVMQLDHLAEKHGLKVPA